jgi:pre-mRNA cleavage complex 2 protein Pcf11
MDAYSLVDNPTRKKMEELLQTWKQPVPGSQSTSLVFQPEITRQIETALIRARTAAIQQTQHLNRGTPEMGRGYTATPPGQYRNTPPPQSPFPPPQTFTPPTAAYAQVSLTRSNHLTPVASRSALWGNLLPKSPKQWR